MVSCDRIFSGCAKCSEWFSMIYYARYVQGHHKKADEHIFRELINYRVHNSTGLQNTRELISIKFVDFRFPVPWMVLKFIPDVVNYEIIAVQPDA